MSNNTPIRKTNTTGSAGTLRSVPDQTSVTAHRTDTEDKLWAALHAHPNSTATALSTAAKIGKSTAQKILAKWAADGTVTRIAGIAEGGRRTADLWVIPNPNPAADAHGIPADANPVHNALAPVETVQDQPATQFDPATTNPDGAAGAEEGTTNSTSSHTIDCTDNAPDTDEAAGTTDTDTTAPVDAAPVAGEPAEAAKPPETIHGISGESRATGDEAWSEGSRKANAHRLAPGALRGMVEDYLRDHPGEEFGPVAIAKALGGKSSGAVSNICGSSESTEQPGANVSYSDDDIVDVLATLEAEGRVVRVDSDGHRWRAVQRRRERLPQGALHGLVEDFLREHDEEAFGPSAIGTALGRSSGAVANALVRLTERCVAMQTAERPRRYSIAGER